MKKQIKKYCPKIIFNLIKKITTFLAIKYYSTKYKPLIVRKNTTDPDVFRQIFVQRDYHLPIKIKPKLIIDAGAYVGYSSLYFSSKYPKAKIIAIEPEKSNFKILKKNTERIPNIKRINAGLRNKTGFLKIIDNNVGHWGFSTKETKNPNPNNVEATTINKILKESGFKKIDILKIDIEGDEEKVFLNNYEWIERVKS